MAHSPPPKLWYLPNHHDALQAHMHLLHKLGNAKTEANYHAYYLTLTKDGTASGATSNAYLTSSYVPFETKCIIMKYRTGTLYNQKHAVWFKHSINSTSPLCPQLVDSALHILSGYQHKKYVHWETQLSMQHDRQSHQQNMLFKILLCLHGCRQQQKLGNAKYPDPWYSWQIKYTEIALSTPLLRQ